jgi:hypothetical protein
MRRLSIAALALASAGLIPHALAADVGGWFSDQQKPPVPSGASECAVAIREAASDPTAINAYRAALCYLQAETPDPLAATAWLQRSAEMQFMPADRMLRILQAAQAGQHGSTRHCHDLGEGRQLCHGGSAPAFAATPAPTPKN